jgi:hypothetical protein
MSKLRRAWDFVVVCVRIDFVLRRMDGIERQYVVNCLKALWHKPFTG